VAQFVEAEVVQSAGDATFDHARTEQSAAGPGQLCGSYYRTLPGDRTETVQGLGVVSVGHREPPV
jgi:hypothetical protein